MKRIPTATALLCLLLAGCSNPFEKYYVPSRFAEEVQQEADSEPELWKVRDSRSASLDLLKRGYTRMGTSCFSSTPVNENKAIDFGEDIGAEIVLLTTKYLGSLSGVRSYVLPNPPQYTTAQHQGGLIMGGNYVPYSGTTTTMTEGGYSAYYLPYTHHYFEYTASYWNRLPRKP